MKLLNRKSILVCNEDEIEKHNDEIMEIIEKVLSFNDYDCALLCKYQDSYHKKIKQKVYGCKFSEVMEEIQRFDIKNGVDMMVDENGYLTLVIYGQGYEYNEEFNLITMAVKILPYNECKDFMDVYCFVKGKSDVPMKSSYQY